MSKDIDLFEVVKNLVADINDMVELQKEYDENDGFYDYLEGCIATRELVISKLGYQDYLTHNATERTYC
jgi:hypothetical protein